MTGRDGPVLHVGGWALGYCHQCARPAPVANMAARGWRHGFSVCAACLRDMARAIDEATPKLAGGKRDSISELELDAPIH